MEVGHKLWFNKHVLFMPR